MRIPEARQGRPRPFTIRPMQLLSVNTAAARSTQGAGTWAIGQVWDLVGLERRPALRLTVFKDNPARALYERMGLRVVGEDECFLRMQRDAGA